MAVRLPKKYSMPAGDVFIEEEDGKLIITKVDEKGWGEDLEEIFAPLADLEIPERKADSRPIEF